MKLIRPVFLTFFAFVCFVLLPHAAEASLQREGIVAVVNDSVISHTDMRNRIRLNMTGFQGQMTPEIQQKIEQQSLDALINEALQMQEAARLDISVSQQQVNEAVDQVAKNNKIDPQEFRARLKAAGVHLSTLEDQVRAEVAWSYVVQRKLRPQVNISETEIDATFQRIEHQRTRHQYRIAEIVLKGADDEALNSGIQEVVDHLQKGAPFPAVAQHYSKSATSSRGGDLGWMDEQQLPAEYRDAVLNLEKGQLAPPLQVDGGVAIVLLIDKYDAEKDGAIVAEPMAEVTGADTDAAAGEMRVTLKQIVIPVAEDEPEAVIVAKTARAGQLAQEINGCAEMAEKSKHFLAAATGDIGTVSLSALPPQIAAMVADLPIGKVSAPIRHRDGVGVLMVCAREGEAKTAAIAKPTASTQKTATAVSALSEQDEAKRDEVANRLGMERLSRLQEHYLRDLRAAAYIELRTQ